MDKSSVDKIVSVLCEKFDVENNLDTIEFVDDGFSPYGSKEYWLGEGLGRSFHKYVNPEFFKRSAETQRSLRIYAKLSIHSDDLISKGVAQAVLTRTVMRCAGLAADEKGADFLDERLLSITKTFEGCKIAKLMCESAKIVFNASEILHENAKNYSFRTLVRLPFEEAVIYLKENYGVKIL
jgi:hypothetical protein